MDGDGDMEMEVEVEVEVEAGVPEEIIVEMQNGGNHEGVAEPEAEAEAEVGAEAEAKPEAEAEVPGDAKNARRPRREVEMPEITDEELLNKRLEHVQRPNRDEMHKEVDDVKAQIEALRQRANAITEQINEAKKYRSGNRGEMDSARNLFQQMKRERDEIYTQKQSILAELQTARADFNRVVQDDRNTRSGLQYSSAEAIDAEIATLETKQQRVSMSLAEEKRILKQISDLRTAKRAMQQLNDNQASITSTKDRTAQLNALLDEKSAQLKVMKERMDDQAALMRNLKGDETEDKTKIPQLMEQRKQLFADMDDLKEKMNKIRDEFKVNETQWIIYRKLSQRKRDLERKQQDDERKLKEEEAKKLFDEEEAKKIPYEEEMELCDHLIHYLTTSFLTTTDASSADADESAAETKVEMEMGGKMLHAIRRDDDDGFLGKKKRKTKSKDKKKPAGIRHTIDDLRIFSLLQIAAPANAGQVGACVEQVREKKAWYQQQPRGAVPTIRENAKKQTAKAQTESEGRKSRKAFTGVAVAEFPSLPGAKAAPTVAVADEEAEALETEAVEEVEAEAA